MLHDFQMFETYMESPSFQNLSEGEKEDFIISYNNLIDEEMDLTLAAAKQVLHRKSIADLFFSIYGHLDAEAILEKDSEWRVTFGFSPASLRK